MRNVPWVGANVLYFETGQESTLSADAFPAAHTVSGVTSGVRVYRTQNAANVSFGINLAMLREGKTFVRGRFAWAWWVSIPPCRRAAIKTWLLSACFLCYIA
ncbi:MAG: hypothetical protein JWN92_2042 [Candidatus Acidoferrum typicum]|nr:hypothetical protein [Candidatus Acidoferrum typicum]